MMKPIPISAAAKVAKSYGYDQIIIIGRKVGEGSEEHGEHVTTYGINKAHCDAAAIIGDHLKYKVMGWPDPNKLPCPGASEEHGCYECDPGGA